MGTEEPAMRLRGMDRMGCGTECSDGMGAGRGGDAARHASRRWWVATVVVAWGVVSAEALTAQAVGGERSRFSVTVGAAVPRGSLDVAQERGWHTALGYHARPSAGGWQLRGELALLHFPGREVRSRVGDVPGRFASMTGIALGTGLSRELLSSKSTWPIRPYATAGVAGYAVDGLSFAANAGAGVRWRLGRRALIAEARYDGILASGRAARRFVPVVVGVVF